MIFNYQKNFKIFLSKKQLLKVNIKFFKKKNLDNIIINKILIFFKLTFLKNIII